MARDVANVKVPGDGRAYYAPAGTTLPTDTSTSATTAGFTELGWIAADGLLEDLNESYSEIKGIDGTTLAKVLTAFEHTIKVTFREDIAPVKELFYGSAEVVSGSESKLTVSRPDRTQYVMVFDVFDGTGIRRICAETVEVTGRESVPYKNDDSISYGMTLTLYPNDSGETAIHYFSHGWSAS